MHHYLIQLFYSKTEITKTSSNFVGSLHSIKRDWLWKQQVQIWFWPFFRCRPNVRRDYSHGDYVDGGDVLLTRSTTVDEGKSDLNGHNRVPPYSPFFSRRGKSRFISVTQWRQMCKEFVDNFSKMMTFNFICLTFEADLSIEVHSWSLSVNFSFELLFSKFNPSVLLQNYICNLTFN